MKITDIRTYALSAAVNTAFYYAEGWVTRRNSLIVEVSTDDGVTGYGEAMCHGPQPPEMARAVVETICRPLLLGQDPRDVEVLWDRMYAATQPYGRQGLPINAISGVDVALWDCMGKAFGLPVYKLLGGAFRTCLRPYATGFFRREGGVYPEESVEEALRYTADGFTSIKLKIGYGPADDARVIRAIRAAVGPDVEIMVDANSAYTAGSARRLLPVLEECDVAWFEEPLPPDDMEGYRSLKGSVPIAMGECLFAPNGFLPWIEARAADVLQPDICFSGGFTGCRRILAMARAANLRVVPHIWGSGIGLAASMQFIAALPPQPITQAPIEPMLEYDRSEHPFRQELIYGALGMEKDGTVAVPSAPGLGIGINRELLRRYA